MRLTCLATILFLFCTEIVTGQTWQSIQKSGSYETVPYNQFTIDPYTNNIWLIRDTKVSVIENNGSINIFSDAELGTLWTGDELKFTFTPANIYYGVHLFGIYKFTGYNSTIFDSSISDFIELSSNLDTIYVTMGYPNGFIKYHSGNSQIYYKYFSKINAKHNYFYGHDGSSVIYEYDQLTNTSVNLTSDPDYLFGIFHDTKFSRLSDTLFVAGKKGISFAYNYDFLDTITPNNTIGMPSANVLEIEFDENDSLWAVFGDAADNPIGLAKLDGSTWTHFYDSSNSPIDFSNFLGLEIDTLGNLWVADNMALHTLLTPNSPQWLSTLELEKETNLSVYPNPTNAILSLNCSSMIDYIELTDMHGRSIKSYEIKSKDYQLNVDDIESGPYLLNIHIGNAVVRKRIVKE